MITLHLTEYGAPPSIKPNPKAIEPGKGTGRWTRPGSTPGRFHYKVSDFPELVKWLHKDRWTAQMEPFVQKEVLDRYTNMVLEPGKAWHDSLFRFDLHSPYPPNVKTETAEFHRNGLAVDPNINWNIYSKDMPKSLTDLNGSAFFRGLDSDEMKSIISTGYIKSTGEYNLGEIQQDLTLYANSPDTAQSYAGSFAPISHKPTFGRPGYIVAVSKTPDFYQSGKAYGVTNEWATKEKVPTGNIVNVTEVRLWKEEPGYVEVYDQGELGSTSHPSQYYAYRDVTNDFRRVLRLRQ
jgi:hypothetical protein